MTTQLSFGRVIERVEQKRQLARVRGRIAESVSEFAQQRGYSEFRIDELQQFVRDRVAVAPASPDRILRDMRSKREINYEVVSRRGARYRFLPLPP